MTRVLEGLTLNKGRIRENLEFLHGINMAEAIMIELTRRGMDRQNAHEHVRCSSMKALETRQPLSEVLSHDPTVIGLIKPYETEELLNPDRYYRYCSPPGRKGDP